MSKYRVGGGTCAHAHWCQKRVSDTLKLSYRRLFSLTWCGCWELNLCPLEEQQVLVAAEPSLQPKDERSCFARLCCIEINATPWLHKCIGLDFLIVWFWFESLSRGLT